MALDEKIKQGMEFGLEHAVRIVQTRISQSVISQGQHNKADVNLAVYRFEQKVLQPCMEYGRQFADRRPIPAVSLDGYV
jgi:hypothetical protein